MQTYRNSQLLVFIYHEAIIVKIDGIYKDLQLHSLYIMPYFILNMPTK